jgi:hypothetical protein
VWGRGGGGMENMSYWKHLCDITFFELDVY